MDCLPLLRLSARLLDLHDAARAPGNSPIYTQEERAGLRDGRYLDLASLVLDALRDFAHESGNAFTGFDAILIAVRENVASVEHDDLRYVLNVLSRPTELWSIERVETKADLVSDKHTNLVEKTYYADDYRLTAVGRAAITIAGNINSFAYAEGDALKLLRAIEAGDFDTVPVFCDSLLDTIRYESVDLRQESEKGRVDRESEVFKVKLPRFRKVIEQTSELLRLAEAKLHAWRASEHDDLDDKLTIDIFDLEQRVLRVYQALESFGRDLSDLTRMAAQRRGSAVSPPDFLAAALGLVTSPPTDRQVVRLFRQFGPVSMNGTFPSPMDAAGKVRVPNSKTDLSPRFETDGAVAAIPDVRLHFLNQFSDAIRHRLSQGPLPMSEALENGWCVLDGKPALGELLGVYLTPWSLGEAAPIEIRVPRDMIGRTDVIVGEVIFSNLELVLHAGSANP